MARTVKFDYAGWFPDLSDDLLAIASVQLPMQDRYCLVKRVDDLDAEGVVELTALEWAATRPFSRILAHSEYDLLRAARLREHFGLPGQGVESALAYRDKVIMKEYLKRAGIPIAQFRRVLSPVDLFEFVEEHGYPVVVKPVDSSGSHGVFVVRDRAELQRVATITAHSQQIVESFIDGEMYHVNGIITSDGADFLVPCGYINGALDYQTGRLFGSRTIDPGTPLAQRLMAFARRAIDALPPADPLAFHAEIFVTSDGGLFLCEVAARTPGCLVSELTERSYGINLHREWARAQAGLPLRLSAARQSGVVAASLRVPRKAGRLVKLPADTPFPWVSTLYSSGNVGAVYEPATTYTDDVLVAMVTADSDALLLDRIAEFSDWLGNRVVWQT
ncbi:hypothetical protein WK56_19395 [Burkholderia ubonensis]|uniref:ATP-grasp domain-containing protein n=1 Tax=Burkholderia ubonensis TaxID=101571 RepID=UPI00075F2CC9|nr:ATP-grasp domain-containing protein [Burkholderia ubonensis]KVT70098.1 hypothetical protein WK56_19395 [Burkholderia ubonensis]